MNRPDELELLYKTKTSRRRFSIGVPASTGRLMPLTPEGVSILVSQGIDVKIERGAGVTLHYGDERYARSGAMIVERTEALNSEIVIYLTAMSERDAMLIRPHAVLLTFEQSVVCNPVAATILLGRRVTALAIDNVGDNRGNRPLRDVLGEAGGRAVVTLAASLLADPVNGKGILLGGVAGVNPCEVVILGSGVAAMATARSAVGQGAMVRIFDNDTYGLRDATINIGPGVICSALHPSVLGHALASADVVVATALTSRFAVDDSVIDSMKSGVVIFDLDSRNGISPVFPTLHCVDMADSIPGTETFGRNVCFINAIGAVPRTVAMAVTNNIVLLVDRIFGSGAGLRNVIKADNGIRNAVMTFLGHVVHAETAGRLGTKQIDINFLLSFS